ARPRCAARNNAAVPATTSQRAGWAPLCVNKPAYSQAARPRITAKAAANSQPPIIKTAIPIGKPIRATRIRLPAIFALGYQAAKAALALSKFSDGFEQLFAPKVWPVRLREDPLRIGCLPYQEVAGALFA